MHFRLKTTLLIIFAALLLAALVCLSACASTATRIPIDEWSDVDGCAGAIVYSPAAFDAAKDDWYGGEGSLLTDEAERGALSDVSVGEEYYLIYTKTHIKDSGVLGYIPYSFTLRQQNALLEQTECVTLGELFYDENCAHQTWAVRSNPYELVWKYENLEYVETEEGLDYITDYVFTYVVLPFTPLQAGQLIISCGEDTVCLNVVAAENADEGAFAEISSVRMAIAEAGSMEELSSGASLEETIYINNAYELCIEFDVKALEEESRKQFTCAILYKGEGASFRIDEANTSDITETKFGEADALLLRFSVPLQAGQKETYRVVVGLNATAEGELLVDLAFLSEQGHLEGDLFGASCVLSSQEGEELTDGEFTYRYLWQTQSYEITGWNYYGALVLDLPDTFRGLPVSRVGRGAFSGISMTRLILGNEITELDASAFSGCKELEQIVFNNKLEIIGESAFRSCTSLQSVELPDSVHEIGRYAFYGCALLKEFVWPANIPSIAFGTFQGSGLQKIVFKGEVTQIGQYAFAFCDDLLEFDWPAGVSSVEDSVFESSGLQRVTFGGTVTEIGEDAFSRCVDLTQIELPASLERIGDNAFAYTPLQSVYIPANVYEIGDGAFNCGSGIYIEQTTRDMYNGKYTLQEFVVDPENKHYASDDGVLFTKDMKTLLLFPMGSEKVSYAVPEGVTQIGTGAFAVELEAEGESPVCPEIAEITLPSTLLTIESGAFKVRMIRFVDGQYAWGTEQHYSVVFTDGGDWKMDGDTVMAEVLADPSEAARLLSIETGIWHRSEAR